jgi:hypothetical protein
VTAIQSKRRLFFAGQQTSAQCPLWVKSGRDAFKFRCLLYPRKRTFHDAVPMSEKGPLGAICSAAVSALFDQQKLRWDGQAQPAKVGDKLTTRDFGTGTRGFAASEDANVAVWVQPGTELSFASSDLSTASPPSAMRRGASLRPRLPPVQRYVRSRG